MKVAKRIHWLDLPGNKYLKKLEKAMLSSDGCIVFQKIKPIGNSRSTEPELVRVTYDQQYVANRINIEILQPLEIQSLDGLVQLMTTIWHQIQLPKAG